MCGHFTHSKDGRPEQEKARAPEDLPMVAADNWLIKSLISDIVLDSMAPRSLKRSG